MKRGHIPLRKCAGCGERKPKEEFIRVVFCKEREQLLIDKTYKTDGRGIYVCKDMDCLKKTKKSRRIERTFSKKVKVNEEIYGEIERMIL